MSDDDQFGPTAVAVSDSAETLSADQAGPEDFAGDVFAPGSRIGERYRIDSLLGAGGMGAVYSCS